MSYSVKEISLPRLDGDFFVTYDHMELTRLLIDCGSYLISIFSVPCVFPKLSFTKEYPLAFKADFDLRKVKLRAETCFAII